MFLVFLACTPQLYTEVKPPCEDGDNVWSHTAESTEELDSQGVEVGERPPNFCQQDQNDNTVSLYQFYGSPIVVDVSTGWCAPCQELAGEIGLTLKDYEDFGLVYISVLPEDYHFGSPTPEFADAWEKDQMVRTHDDDDDGEIDFPYGGLPLDDIAPVIADVDLWSFAVTESAFPALLLLDGELRVVAHVSPPNDEGLRDELDDFFGLIRE